MTKVRKKFGKIVLLSTLIFMIIPIIYIFNINKTIAEGASNLPDPVGPTPNDRQIEWHHREQMGFIHFGMNTFYNVEWGDGSEDPARFNPTQLDANQWVKTFKDAGFTTIIMVAKHHDGFCLWPSAYTTHDVASSQWKNGNGDVIREVADACEAAGIKLGIYLSPWDRHEESYGTSAYNDYFDNQLKELLTNYGTIWEIWFDGAGEQAGTYDWARWEKTIHSLQPNCVIWGAKSAAPYAETRWIGNEGGVAGDPCWALIDPYYIEIEDNSILSNGQVNGSKWIPAETNTSIRPGWFYHSSEDSMVKSVDTLWNYYFNSVGRNTVMLLNIPPDTRGLMSNIDANNILEMYGRVENTFSNNLAADSTVTATDIRGSEFNPKNLVDKDEDTYYASSDGVTTPTIEFEFDGEKTFDCVMLQEVIKLGHRVTGWTVEAYYNNSWNTLVTKESVGYKWIERFNPVTASAVRLVITGAKACPVIHSFGVYLQSDSSDISTPEPTYPIVSAYSQIEAEDYNSKFGTVKEEACDEGGQNLGYISTGDYVVYKNVNFGDGAASFQARVASTVNTGKIYVRLDTPTGTQVGTLTVPNTGDSQTYTNATCTISRASGIHDLYLVFDEWANLNWFKFTASEDATPTSTIAPSATPIPTQESTYVRIRNNATGLYIDGMGSTSNGSNACQWSDSNSNNQQWKIIKSGDYVMIQNRVSGLYLDGMGRTSNGSVCGQWSNSGSDNQQWAQETSGSNVRFKNRATGLYLDGMGSSSNGSDLCQWENSGSSNQQWNIE